MLLRTVGLFFSNFHLDKASRKKHRNKVLDDYSVRMKKKLKFGVSYSVFNGFELLESSILSIRESVDYVNIVYQTKSWYGDDASPELLPTIIKLKEKGLVDEIILYEGSSEIEKRNIGLKAAYKAGVKYFMTMDCDEFFIKEEVERAKQEIIRHRYTNTYVPVVEYHIKPEYRSLKPTICIPFFAKLYWFSKIKKPGYTNPCIVDPTRPVNIFSIKFLNIYLLRFDRVFVFTFFNMHHMTTIRKDYYSKFKNDPHIYENIVINNTKLNVDNIIFHDFKLSDLKKITDSLEDKKPIQSDIIKVKNIFNIKIQD